MTMMTTCTKVRVCPLPHFYVINCIRRLVAHPTHHLPLLPHLPYRHDGAEAEHIANGIDEDDDEEYVVGNGDAGWNQYG